MNDKEIIQTAKEIDKLFGEMFPEQKGEENGHRKN